MARQINKPALGRPADSRITAETIANDPRLSGVEPFDPAQDVDIVDEINNALIGISQDIEASAPELRLDDLTDVSVTNAADGQVLTRTGSTWVARTPANTGITNAVLSDQLASTALDYVPVSTNAPQGGGATLGIYGMSFTMKQTVTADYIVFSIAARKYVNDPVKRLIVARLASNGTTIEAILGRSANSITSAAAGDHSFRFSAPIVFESGRKYVVGLDGELRADTNNYGRETLLTVGTTNNDTGVATMNGWWRSNDYVSGSIFGPATVWQHRIKLATLSSAKNAVGSLDPVDLPGYDAATAGQVLARGASGLTWQTVSGDVKGPATSTTYTIPVFADSTGKTLTSSSYTAANGSPIQSVGGNSRGGGALDLQVARNLNDQVAGGYRSAIWYGESNRVGQNAVHATANGNRADAWAVNQTSVGIVVETSNAQQGGAQDVTFRMGIKTSAAGETSLRTDGGIYSNSTVYLNLPGKNVLLLQGQLIATNYTDSASWECDIHVTSANGQINIISSTQRQITATSGASSWAWRTAVTEFYNVGNCLDFRVTGPGGVSWMLVLRGVMLRGV